MMFMEIKRFTVLPLITIIGLSVIPLQQADGKGFIFGGQPDLRISLLGSETYDDNMHIPKENFHMIIDDMDKLPVLFGSTIFPAIKEQLLRHESGVKDHYMESIGVVYNMNKDTMDVNKMQIYIDVQPELVSETVIVEPAQEAKMSIIKRVGIHISVYANLTYYEYEDILNEIEKQTIHRIKIVASQAKDTLSKHRNELLASVLEGEGSLTNKIRIQAISMEMLSDIVRVNVSYPEGKDDRVKFINEIRPAIIFESRVNSIMLGEPEIVTEFSPPLTEFPLVGWELIVQSELQNMIADDIQFTYIVRVKDQDGITVSLDSVRGSVSSNESIRAALAWTPEAAGTYEVGTFVWSDSYSPPLAPFRTTSVKVVNMEEIQPIQIKVDLVAYKNHPTKFCITMEPSGEMCESRIGYQEFPIKVFSDETMDIELKALNVPSGVWVRLVPNRLLNVGPDGASAAMFLAGAVKPFTHTGETETLTIQAESPDGESAKSFLPLIQTDHLTILRSPGPIELVGEIPISSNQTYFRVFGVVYDPEGSYSPLTVKVSVLGLVDDGKTVPLPSWLGVDIPVFYFSLNEVRPYYIMIQASGSNAPTGTYEVAIEEIINGERFVRNLQVTVINAYF